MVCWHGRVCDGAARIFARAFFQAVAARQQQCEHGYEFAFEEAKRAVLLATRRRAGHKVATPLYELRDPDMACPAPAPEPEQKS